MSMIILGLQLCSSWHVVNPTLGLGFRHGVIDPDAQAATYWQRFELLSGRCTVNYRSHIHNVTVHPHSGSEPFVIRAELTP